MRKNSIKWRAAKMYSYIYIVPFTNFNNNGAFPTIKIKEQMYLQKPLNIEQVNGASAKSIFIHMNTDNNTYKDYYLNDYPMDVDDWERCRVLLVWYPEWIERLSELSNISNEWRNLVKNWKLIEIFYKIDHEKYGNKAYKKGGACKLIRYLLKKS